MTVFAVAAVASADSRRAIACWSSRFARRSSGCTAGKVDLHAGVVDLQAGVVGVQPESFHGHKSCTLHSEILRGAGRTGDSKNPGVRLELEASCDSFHSMGRFGLFRSVGESRTVLKCNVKGSLEFRGSRNRKPNPQTTDNYKEEEGRRSPQIPPTMQKARL